MRRVPLTAVAVWLAAALGAMPGPLPGGLAPAAAQTPFRPVATVNKSLITAFDIDQRARVLAMLGASAPSEQALASMALDALIEDRLKMEAARQAGLASSPEVIQTGLAAYAERFGTTPEAFRAGLESRGVTDQAIEDLMSSQMLWREVVNERFRGRIEVGEAEIDAEIALAARETVTRLRLQEIGLPIAGDGRTPEETRALAERLWRQLVAGADFAAAAREYSRAASAENGGQVGWIAAGDLPPQLASAVAAVEEGGIARPQEVQGGISILRVLEREFSGGGTVDPSDPELRERVRRELMTRRLELLSQGLIQELRRDAMIELR